tara:strand:- start:306 stop:488 length:183 start_codon:yes stop_codon:yes gene_type:complete
MSNILDILTLSELNKRENDLLIQLEKVRKEKEKRNNEITDCIEEVDSNKKSVKIKIKVKK